MKKIISAALILIMLFALVPAVHGAKQITSIHCEDSECYEYTEGYVERNHDSSGHYLGQFYYYDAHPKSIYVEFSDGSHETYYDFDSCMDGTGSYPFLATGQTPSTPWGPGKHKVTMSLGSGANQVKTDYYVTVKPGIVDKLEIGDITVVEYIDGYTTKGFNMNTHMLESYFYYNYYNSKNLNVKATLKDGTVVEDAYWGIDIDGESWGASYGDDQSMYNKWGVGPHTVKAYMLGAECEFTVNVVSCPIDHIVYHDVWLYKGIHDYDWYGKTYYQYNAMFTVYFKDGCVEESDEGSIDSHGIHFYAYPLDDQVESPWGVGAHLVTIGGGAWFDGSFIVHVENSPYVDLHIQDGEDNQLYAEFIRANGDSDTYRVDNFTYSNMEQGMIRAHVKIAGQGMTAYFDCGHDNDFMPRYEDNVYCVIGDLTSNDIQKTAWLKRNILLPRFSDRLYDFKEYEPTFTGLSRDDYREFDIVTLACNYRDVFLLKSSDYYCDKDGRFWGFLTEKQIKEAVNYIFGVNIDVSKYPYYDPMDRSRIPVMILRGTDYLQWTDLSPDGLNWYYMSYYEDDDGEPMTADFFLDARFTLKSIDVLGGPKPVVQGDVDGDGVVTMKDVLLLRKLLAGAATAEEGSEALADVDGDGVVTMKDVLLLRKILAGAA